MTQPDPGHSSGPTPAPALRADRYLARDLAIALLAAGLIAFIRSHHPDALARGPASFALIALAPLGFTLLSIALRSRWNTPPPAAIVPASDPTSTPGAPYRPIVAAGPVTWIDIADRRLLHRFHLVMAALLTALSLILLARLQLAAAPFHDPGWTFLVCPPIVLALMTWIFYFHHRHTRATLLGSDGDHIYLGDPRGTVYRARPEHLRYDGHVVAAQNIACRLKTWTGAQLYESSRASTEILDQLSRAPRVKNATMESSSRRRQVLNTLQANLWALLVASIL